MSIFIGMTAKMFALAVAMVPMAIGAQTTDKYPERPIKLIVPFPPGGGTDMFGRIVAQQLTESQGWNIVVENRPGAGGNIGVDAATKAAPDGYTIVLGQTSNLAINPTLFKNLPYEPKKDLAPIVLVAASPITVAVGADSRFKSLQEITAAAREKPDSVSLGFSGNGTVAHLTGAFMQSTDNIKFIMVPYKGAANAMTDLMGNRIDIYMSSVPTLLGYIRDKKLRAVGVTSAKRIGVLPDVPTVSETPGFENFEAVSWFGLLAPAGTPAPIINKINVAVNDILKKPKVIEKLHAEGSEILGGTPEQFKQRLDHDTQLWAKVVGQANVKIN